MIFPVEIERDETGTAHIVALSGGKDSTCMAVLLAEREPRPYTFICTPTGDELPEMFEHWKSLGERLGRPVIPVMAGSLNGLIKKWNALPNWRQRWCTRVLKIEPYEAFLQSIQSQGPTVSYVGLRADEEDREGGDYSKVQGVTMRWPLREWCMDIGDVVAELDARGIAIPERTDCARCFYQTLSEWWWLWKLYPDLFAEAEAQEEATGYTFRSDSRDTWPAALKELRAEFEKGRVPGGVNRQEEMFANMKCRACRK